MDIKENSLFSRQFGIIHPKDLNKSVIIVGAGGIGSWTALALAKTGVKKLTIIDFDYIEEANFAPQFYNKNHNKRNKAQVLAERVIEESSGHTEVTYIDKAWEEIDKDELVESSMADSLIMAVDSMDVRINIWNDIKYLGLDFVIDGRMSREMMELHAIKMSNEAVRTNYEQKHLFPSSTVEHVECTERAVAYNQFVIAGLITATFKKFAKEELDYKRVLFDLTTMTLIVA